LPLAAIAFTRSPALVAGLELARSLPWLVFALPVGALADRLDRRRTMIGANIVRTAAVAVLAVVLQTGNGSIPILYVVAIATGIAEVFYDTSSQSILPSLVRHDQLGRANGRLGAIELGTQQFLGPPLAGLLVGVAVAVAFWTTTALWALAIAALMLLPGVFRPERSTGSATLRSDIATGLRFLMSRPTLRTMAAMVGIANLASSAAGAVLVLYAVGDGSVLELTQAQFGLLFLTAAAGSIAVTAINEGPFAPRTKFRQARQSSPSSPPSCNRAQARSSGRGRSGEIRVVSMSSAPIPLIGCRQIWAICAFTFHLV
jgi:MFS family permease